MPQPRFLQIHTLSSYAATLLNRDDSGLAKRLPYGDALRTRISSQCLKRHWRIADDPHALSAISGAEAAYRSRELVTKMVVDRLRGRCPDEILRALEPEFQMAVYGDKGTTKKARQTLLFGQPEITWLVQEAEHLAALAQRVGELIEQATSDAGAVASNESVRAALDLAAETFRSNATEQARFLKGLLSQLVAQVSEAQASQDFTNALAELASNAFPEQEAEEPFKANDVKSFLSTAQAIVEASDDQSSVSGNARSHRVLRSAVAIAVASAWRTAFRGNMKAMRESTSLPAGLASALFGRMVTSDTDANITAPVHVAHAFTVHAEEAESDYFTAVDDLSIDEPGADTIQETELTSGLFYGYVVVDVPGLLANLSGDAGLAGQVLHNLIYLVAEVSPGAKLGSTAPYGRASFMLVEAGDRQPRSLAEAYRKPCQPQADRAVEALSKHLEGLDKAYSTGEDRIVMSLMASEVPGAAQGSLAQVADWVKSLPGRVQS